MGQAGTNGDTATCHVLARRTARVEARARRLDAEAANDAKTSALSHANHHLGGKRFIIAIVVRISQTIKGVTLPPRALWWPKRMMVGPWRLFVVIVRLIIA